MNEKKFESIEDLPKYKKLLLKDKGEELSARKWILRVLLFIFALGNIACISLYFFNGFNLTHLTDIAMCSLSIATASEVAGLLTILIRFYFKK